MTTTKPHRLRDGMMGGGMVLISFRTHAPDLPLDGMIRLATWLGVAPRGPFQNVGLHRHALVMALGRAEADLRRMSKVKRGLQPIAWG